MIIIDRSIIHIKSHYLNIYLVHLQEGFIQALMDYAVDLDNGRWRYRTWTLSDIAVLKWEFKVGHRYDMVCMEAIARVVPTVRSFAGRGNMNEEPRDFPTQKPDVRRLLHDLENRKLPIGT